MKYATIAMLVVMVAMAGCLETGTGTANGVITSVENDGVIWKTYTIYIKTDAASTKEESYCIEPENHALAQQLRGYAANRTPVEISFTNEFAIGPWRCTGDGSGNSHSNTMITGVRPTR